MNVVGNQQAQPVTGENRFTDLAMVAAFTPQGAAGGAGECADELRPGIVPCACVLGTGIAEADDKLDRCRCCHGCAGKFLAETSRCNERSRRRCCAAGSFDRGRG